MMQPLAGLLLPLGFSRRARAVGDPALLIAYATPLVQGTTLLNEGAGGATYHGTVSGATVNSGAVVFDGVDDSVSIPWSAWSSELTIALWVYRTASGVTQYLLHGGNATAAPFVRLTTLNRPGITLGSTISMHAGTAIAAESWTQLAIVIPASGIDDGVIYLNGVPAAVTISNTGVVTAPQSTALLGRSRGTNYPFAGSVGNVAIYTRALSGGEVAALFAAQRGKYGV